MSKEKKLTFSVFETTVDPAYFYYYYCEYSAFTTISSKEAREKDPRFTKKIRGTYHDDR